MIIRIKSPTSLLRLNIPEDSTFDSILPSKFNTQSYVLSYDSSYSDLVETDKPLNTIPRLKDHIILYATFTVKKEHSSRKISRGQDKLLCNHDTNVMCANCTPLDPWDEKYHKEKEIKYLSYETYKEKIKVDGRILEMENYKYICTHPKNEVCLKCNGLIYLRPQIYRMTDHIEFESKEIIEHFLSFYRNSHRQRFGILIGKYQPYDRTPLGKKATVSSIYEPKQESYPDGFIIKEEENKILKRILNTLELEVVGIIYTAIGNKREYFLSSLEIKFISEYQNKYPFYDNNKIFNSQLVTVVCTTEENEDSITDIKNNIKIEPYQISSQAMALLKENIIEATSNPMVFRSKRIIVYRDKEENKVVEKKSDPYFPVDYFIVKPTYGILSSGNIIFKNKEYFNAENNSYKKLALYFNFDYEHNKFYNLNLLLRLGREVEIEELLKSIKFNSVKYYKDFINSEGWKEIKQRLEKYKTEEWQCSKCTFINVREKYDCEMCGLPKND